MPDATTTIFLHEGNVRTVPFTLRTRGSRDPWDVSSATSIVLEAQRGPVKLAPIVANPAHAAANWEAGIVAITIGTSVTGVVGTYECVITVYIGAEVISLPHMTTFRIEVGNRPGYPP